MKYLIIQMKETSKSIVIELDELIAPIAIKSIGEIIKKGKYNNKPIERLEPNFVIQPLFFDGIDSDIDKLIDPEFNTNPLQKNIPFTRYTVGMAGDGKNIASGSQFFITLNDAPWLNGLFTVIGKVVDGFSEIERIEKLDVKEIVLDDGSIFHSPLNEEVIASISLIDDYVEAKKKIDDCENEYLDIFTTNKPFSNNLIKYTSRYQKDKYDDNFFYANNEFSKEEYDKAINYQLDNNDNFLKILSNKKLDNIYDLESGSIITMVFNGDINNIKVNSEVIIRKPLLEEVTDIEIKHYGECYGIDFCTNNVKTLYEHINYIGAYLDNKLVGACYYNVTKDAINLDGLIVDSEYRNRYVASTIIRYIIENNKDKLIYLHADIDDTPKDMYTKMGFITIDEEYEYALIPINEEDE